MGKVEELSFDKNLSIDNDGVDWSRQEKVRSQSIYDCFAGVISTSMTTQTRSARREELLEAATRAFAQRGYFGTSTKRVALEAGVSQPYIIQVFRTKEQLFLEVHERAGKMISQQMHEIAASSFDMTKFSAAYRKLLIDRTLLLVIMHGFTAASIPAIGRTARELFMQMYDILTNEAGASPEEARDFLARGMLINTVLAIGIDEHATENPWVRPLLDVLITDESMSTE